MFKGGDNLEENLIHLDNVKEKKKKYKRHIPSKIQPDTLFTFCNKLEYLIPPLQSKMISARYCEEDISYLKIPKIRKISFPMKCFCDINMHKLSEHLSGYGYYGLALTKEWGMKNEIQPVQYINQESPLVRDFSNVFSNALKIKKTTQTKNEKLMKNYLIHQLMYLKPYSGYMINRNTGKRKKKCFTDECEWRYIPKVSDLGYKQIYYNEKILNNGNLNDISDSLKDKPEISLQFDYEDLKYIIVNNREDLRKVTKEIDKIENINEEEKALLMSKIIVWELSGGDF